MSQYLILVSTSMDRRNNDADYDLTHYIDFPIEPYYALTTSNQPPVGLSLLQNYCPLKLKLIHSIHSGTQTDSLDRTLRAKFQSQLLHSFWYAFTPDDIIFIKSLNERNFSSMIGFIQRQLKKPEMNQTQTQEFIQEQLKKAESALQ